MLLAMEGGARPRTAARLSPSFMKRYPGRAGSINAGVYLLRTIKGGLGPRIAGRGPGDSLQGIFFPGCSTRRGLWGGWARGTVERTIGIPARLPGERRAACSRLGPAFPRFVRSHIPVYVWRSHHVTKTIGGHRGHSKGTNTRLTVPVFFAVLSKPKWKAGGVLS